MLKRIANTVSNLISGANEDDDKKKKEQEALAARLKANKPVQVTYESNPIPIPADFLVAQPPDAEEITIAPIDWAATPVPEYKGCYAVVLDNVLSPSECAALLRLAEDSVAPASRGEDGSPWRQAMVNVGAGFEVLAPHYRRSDRLIWDQQEVVDRIWARCLLAPGLRERMATVSREPIITGGGKFELRREEGSTFRFVRANNRMRFLKYSGGEFFQAHRDASFGEEVNGKYQESLFTLHLYLNDSQAAVGDSAELIGGATPFLSDDTKRRVDVDPKTGRVLIFQQRKLLHSGDDVKEGVKYTMRTDIMFELVDENEEKTT